MHKIYISIVIFLFFYNSTAQTVIPKNSDIKIEVKTDTLQITANPQIISIEITKEAVENPHSFRIKFNKIESFWTLINASLNGEKLWLIQANSSATNEKVLAWNYDKNESKLILFPFRWSTPYYLEIDVQINMKNISSLKKETAAKVNLLAELPEGLFEAMPVGDGNVISLK